MMPAGAVNGWRCPEGHITCAVHVDSGVTPMFLACRVDGCGERATSMGYPLRVTDAFGQPVRPEWEWYRPSEKQARRMERKAPGMLAHVQRGGLAIRERKAGGR